MKDHNYYIYILTNFNHTVLYIGFTNDLRRRIMEHKQHQIPGFTSRYKVNILVYYEYFSQVQDAIDREKQIKRWRREKKIALIESSNPQWEELELWEE